MTSNTGALSGLKVLDAAGRDGAYAGKLFADMGAEVLWFGEWPDAPDATAIFHNLGKRRIAADLSTCAGIEAVLAHAAEADILIENFASGAIEALGYDRAELQRRYPRLIWSRIVPFGSDGPYQNFKSDDIVNMAAGGMLTLAGYPDREPVLAFGNQSLIIASLYCAVGALTAYYERLRSGVGQSVEVPIQHAVATALENSTQFYDLQKTVRKRIGAGYAEAASGLFPCSDGLVFLMAGRLSTVRGWTALVEWLNEANVEGAAELLEPRWQTADWKARPEAARRFEEIFTIFGRNKKKQDLYVEAQRRGIALCPLNEIADVLNDPQLSSRDFFKTLNLGEMGELLLPGPPYRLSRTPAATANLSKENVASV